MWFFFYSVITNPSAHFVLFLSLPRAFPRPAISQLAAMTALLAQRVLPQIEYAIFDMDGLLST